MKTLLKKYISYCALLPLAVFVWVARYQGLFSQTIKSDAWQIPFYFGATSALIIIAIYFLFGFPINQIALSANLFLIVSAILFFINFEFLLYFLSDYSGSVFFLCVVLTSLFCISTQAKCIIDPELSPSQNRRLCMFLLFGSVFAFIWSLMFNSYGIMISIVIPFVLLRLLSASKFRIL